MMLPARTMHKITVASAYRFRVIEDPPEVNSNPSAMMADAGGYPSGQRGPTVDQPRVRGGGSNPIPPTKPHSPRLESYFLPFHRARAAFRAISRRRSGDNLSIRAFAAFRLRATA